jgi:Saxitoxin biosynthesis operon protein SxtJ
MKKPQSPRQRLRRFGLTVGTALAVLATISWLRGHTTVPFVMLGVAGVLFLPAVVWPEVLAPVERGWLRLGSVLAWFNTRLILTILFYLIVAPIGFVVRLFRDPLDLAIRDRASYWHRRERRSPEPRAYQQQF